MNSHDTFAPTPHVRYVIVDSSRGFVTEIHRGLDDAVPDLGAGVVRLQLRPEIRVRHSAQGAVTFVKPRDPAERTLEEALTLGWARVVEPKPRRSPERPVTPEQVQAFDRLFQKRLRS